MTMAEAIQEFGFDCKIRKLSPKTIANYQKQIEKLKAFFERFFGLGGGWRDRDDVRFVHDTPLLTAAEEGIEYGAPSACGDESV